MATLTRPDYLRARYYDPSTGQFISRDPAVSSTREPYAYTRGNPLNRTDLSGLVFTNDGTFCDSLCQQDLFAFGTPGAPPDYVSVQVSFGPSIGPAASLTRTRSGNVYFGKGVNAGTPGFSLCIAGGWLNQDRPTDQDVENFVGGAQVSAGGYAGFGGSEAASLTGGTSTEAGIGSPQAGATYSWSDQINFNPLSWLFGSS